MQHRQIINKTLFGDFKSFTMGAKFVAEHAYTLRSTENTRKTFATDGFLTQPVK